MRMFGVAMPMSAYSGALIAFTQSPAARALFATWHDYWVRFGRGREMPCLACAVKNSPELRVGTFDEGFFAVDYMDASAVVQHNCEGFVDKIGSPLLQRWHPFDNVDDFSWTKL